MKKTVALIAICMAAVLPAHATEQALPPVDSGTYVAEKGSLTGTVKAVRLSSLMTAPATLLVTDKRGDEVEFTVRASTAIFSDEIGARIALKDLAQGTRVMVRYEKTPEGFLTATSIKVIKPETTAGGRE